MLRTCGNNFRPVTSTSKFIKSVKYSGSFS